VPLALSPYREDTKYLQPDYINNFDYTEPNGRCPFSAHVRKTAPRQLQPIVSKEYLDASVLVRTGIPYGDEVCNINDKSENIHCSILLQISDKEREEWAKLSPSERENAKSPRGLLFVCYQSSIDNGFFRQQAGFANNDFFPITGLVPQKIG
jgi:deferrochelatase/peroxidase EfeB